MGPSVVSQYAQRTSRLFHRGQDWVWPRPADPIESRPDARLLRGSISELTATIRPGLGANVDASVRAITKHDLVLVTHGSSPVPVLGQVVEVSLCLDGKLVFANVQCVLHWSGTVNGEDVLGLFTVEPLGDFVNAWGSGEQRTGIRYPIDTAAAIYAGDAQTADDCDEESTNGRIVDYSLNGCRFVAEDEVSIDNEYEAHLLLGESTVEMHMTPRWIQNTDVGYQMGCSFRPEEGVLLACRHLPQTHGLTTPLKPYTRNWRA